MFGTKITKLIFGVGFSQKVHFLPWLVWLSGLSAGLQTKRSLVQSLVKAHGWVVGQVPTSPVGGGGTRDNQEMCLSHIDVSLPFFLPPFPSL